MRERIRQNDGTYDVEYTLYEDPKDNPNHSGKPATANTSTMAENPTAENPTAENPPYNKERNTKIEIQKKNVSKDTGIEKIDKRIPEIDIIIETIKDHHGSIDGTQLENRRYGKNLKDKMDKIKGFNGDYQGFIKLILDNTDEYNVTKTTSCKALFYNLAALVAKIRAKNQEEKPRRLSIH